MSRLRILCCLPLLVILAGCGGGDTETTDQAAKGACSYTKADTPAARKVDLPPTDPPKELAEKAIITTSAGPIQVAFDNGEAPCTVNSFMSLAEQDYFNDTPCPRLTTTGLSVLQCGDPTGTRTGGPGYTFADELVPDDARLRDCGGQPDPQSGKPLCTYPAGTLAMANAGANTNGSQFFLVHADSQLPAAYTVFGHVDAAGLKVLRAIAAKGAGPDESPKEPVTITSVK